jgi:DNA polymerase III subunit epsilon
VTGAPSNREGGLPTNCEPGPWPSSEPGLLPGADLVVVDVETTGLVPEQAALIEIGAVRLSGTQVTGEFFSLVSPAVPVPADITELTGITDAMVRRAPPAAVALRAFLAFASDAALVAHNAPFDLGFLTSGCAAAGLPWPRAAVLDTAVLARLVLSPEQVPDCKLATLARYFGARVEPCHRALADAQATVDVLLGLLHQVAAAARAPQRPRLPWPAHSAHSRRPDPAAGDGGALAEAAGAAAVR